MASVLVETTKVGTRVVVFNSVLEPYVKGGWLLHDYQVICEWRINISGNGAIFGPLRFK